MLRFKISNCSTNNCDIMAVWKHKSLRKMIRKTCVIVVLKYQSSDMQYDTVNSMQRVPKQWQLALKIDPESKSMGCEMEVGCT